ncbi:F-box/kelch-repeat protein At3g06240-like [Rutidosis leptorrhynchoides]|uniref:F-box/kelch-repeat protein At3g06240-like n=1 Tax=Rutidosis leptorrhynchoides TaxID=125765 RepID=UPI003A99D755
MVLAMVLFCCLLLAIFRIMRLMLSNPTIREFVELPVFDFKIAGHGFASCIMRELGYDSLTDDYKVVTINEFLNWNGADRIMCVHVYSLRRNTWTRVIDYPDKYRPFSITSSAFVNGSFHCVATKVSDNTKVIVAFSLVDENFSEVPSPTLGNGNDVDNLNRASRIVVVDEKLAIFLSFKGEVWLMNEYGVKGSWTKIKLYGLEQVPKFCIPFVFYVIGKLSLVYDKQMLIYDVEDGRLSKRIDIYGNTHPSAYTRFSCVCVENLVSPRFNRLN